MTSTNPSIKGLWNEKTYKPKELDIKVMSSDQYDNKVISRDITTLYEENFHIKEFEDSKKFLHQWHFLKIFYYILWLILTWKSWNELFYNEFFFAPQLWFIGFW